jgi:hypothetical protein
MEMGGSVDRRTKLFNRVSPVAQERLVALGTPAHMDQSGGTPWSIAWLS